MNPFKNLLKSTSLNDHDIKAVQKAKEAFEREFNYKVEFTRSEIIVRIERE